VPRAEEARIVAGILTAISEHRLRAGTKLGEQALCEIYGCSRADVRRALVTLSAHKVVDLKQNRGAFIAVPTPEEARNVFQARRAVEKTLVRNAAARATPEHLRNLRDHVAREGAARRSGNRPEAIRMSGEFHLILGRAGGNDVLLGFLRDLVMRSSLIIGLYATASAPLCEDDDHRLIAEAVAGGDAAAAEALVDTHLRHLESSIRFEHEIPPADLRAILAG
jgi:DNA-binding GntR family transcriptional regulator